MSLGCKKSAREFSSLGAKIGLLTRAVAFMGRVFIIVRRIKPVNLKEKLGYRQEKA